MNKAAHVALVAGLMALAGCDAGSDYNQYFQAVRQSLNGSLGKSRVSLKQAAAIPYASMGWRLDGGNQNIIVLATDNAQEQLWTSAAHIVFLTENGRIKRTVGLPHDLAALAPHGGNDLTPPSAALQAPYEVQLSADFPTDGKFGIILNCRGVARGAQGVTILSKRIAATRVEEHCQAKNSDWDFTNVYWIDRDNGLVWRSLQHIHPHGDTLETEIFRPPG